MHQLESRPRQKIETAKAAVRERVTTATAAPEQPRRPAEVEVEADPDALALELLQEAKGILTWYGDFTASKPFSVLPTPDGKFSVKAGFGKTEALAKGFSSEAEAEQFAGDIQRRIGSVLRRQIGLREIGTTGSPERADFLERERERKYYTAHGYIDWQGKLTEKGREYAGDNAVEIMALQRSRSQVLEIGFSPYDEGSAWEGEQDPEVRKRQDKEALQAIKEDRRREEDRSVGTEDWTTSGKLRGNDQNNTPRKSLWSRFTEWLNE